MVRYPARMTTRRHPLYAGYRYRYRYRYRAELINYTVWLYFRPPLGLRMVEKMLAARGTSVTHETIRRRSLKFGRGFANRMQRRAPRHGDKWHLNEIVISITGKKQWLGVRSTRRALFSMSWSKASAIRRQPSACCANCSRSRDVHRVR